MTITPDAISVTFNTTGTSNTTITGSAPSGIEAGQWMSAFLANRNESTPNGSLTVPAGWQLVSSNFGNDGRWTCHAAIAFKQYTGTESFEFGIVGYAEDDALVIQSWNGDIDPESIVSVGTGDGDPSVSPVCPSLDTIADGQYLVAYIAQNDGWPNALPEPVPTGMTSLFDERSRDNSSGVRVAAAYQVVASAGATGPRTWTNFSASSYRYSGMMFAFSEAAPSGPAVNPTGTDLVLVEGSAGSIALSNMTGVSATALSIRYTNGGQVITEAQDDFAYTAGDAGAGTIGFSATLGDLPYGSSGLQYVITLSEGSPLVTSVTSLSPAAGFSFVVAADPVNDETSWFNEWVEGSSPVDPEAVTGDQAWWQIATDGVTASIAADFLGSTTFDGDPPETPVVISSKYWSSTEGQWYPFEKTISFTDEEPPEEDVTPGALTFDTVLGALTSTAYESNSDEVAEADEGIDLDITVVGGEYAIDAGAGFGAWTDEAGTVQVGDLVKQRVQSSALPNTPAVSTITINGVASSFTVVTAPEEIEIPAAVLISAARRRRVSHAMTASYRADLGSIITALQRDIAILQSKVTDLEEA